MNPSKMAATLLALTMTFSGAAFAQGRGNDGDRGGKALDRQGQNGPGNDRLEGPGRLGPQGRNMERGAGPNHDLRRGGGLPPQYRGRQYVVEDWRSHRLSAPPRGYHWVQSGSDYLLVAITTGVILQLLLNN